ncbi:hypothetical protein J3E68DRAFT_403590 [Trichoderma sp. SZMC 28012]
MYPLIRSTCNSTRIRHSAAADVRILLLTIPIHRASIKLLDQFITWMYRLVPHHRQMHAKTACGYCNEPKRRSAARTTFASTGIVKRWPSPKAPFQYVAHLARIAGLPPTPSATARQNAARSPGEA